MLKNPRPVPFDLAIPEQFRADYIGVEKAAEVAGCHRSTIQRHLKQGSLAGLKVSERKWWVRRITQEGKAPAMDLWEESSPGNPEWKAKSEGKKRDQS